MAPVVGILKIDTFLNTLSNQDVLTKDVLYYDCFLTLLQDKRLGMSKKCRRD
jgi:hypothetical protein